jgi:DNA-binding NarL/FixJ family response regulator
MLGRPDTARGFYLQAVEVCRKSRFRPELALTCLDLADLLLKHYPDERTEALRHLDYVIVEFGAMHMQPSLERAHQLAQGIQVAGSTTRDTEVAGLTARERDVAGLIARGLTNRDIAEALVITEVHVKHILGRLGFRSRSQVAVWAAERGLRHAVDAPG